MSDFTSLLETLTLSGATGGVVSAASNSPHQLSALASKLSERLQYFFNYIPRDVQHEICLKYMYRIQLTGKDEEQKIVTALNSFAALANEGRFKLNPANII